MGPASAALEEARQMTGSMHVADHQGDTIYTWDTADPTTVREIEEIFREAQATGRLVYRQTRDGTGEQVRLATWNPQEHTELFVAPRLAGG
jgi:endo-alpha-1,4-polygalactosaminidase (GH114 family)